MQQSPRFGTILLCYIAVVVCSMTAQGPEAHTLQPDSVTPKTMSLETALKPLTNTKVATIGLSARVVETDEEFSLNGSKQLPTMSVYKFPIALYMLSLVDNHKAELSERVHVTAAEWMEKTYSPLGERCSRRDTMLRLDTLIRAMVGESDNNACDIVLKRCGGTTRVQRYIRDLGFVNAEIGATEREMHKNYKTAHRNRLSAIESSKLLQKFFQKQILSPASTEVLYQYMRNSANPANRIVAGLPEGTEVAHKTGTGAGPKNRVIAANDVALITLPSQRHLALSVFVSDTDLSFDECYALIADITRVIWKSFSTK